MIKWHNGIAYYTDWRDVFDVGSMSDTELEYLKTHKDRVNGWEFRKKPSYSHLFNVADLIQLPHDVWMSALDAITVDMGWAELDSIKNCCDPQLDEDYGFIGCSAPNMDWNSWFKDSYYDSDSIPQEEKEEIKRQAILADRVRTELLNFRHNMLKYYTPEVMYYCFTDEIQFNEAVGNEIMQMCDNEEMDSNTVKALLALPDLSILSSLYKYKYKHEKKQNKPEAEELICGYLKEFCGESGTDKNKQGDSTE